MKFLTFLHKGFVLAAAGAVLAVLSKPATALTATEVQELLAADGAASSRLGYSVALDGDTTVIGARYDGSADAFTRTGDIASKQF